MNLIVQSTATDATTGYVFAGTRKYFCTLGRSGISHEKSEGDGKTPVGTYPLRAVYYRADRIELPLIHLPAHVITRETAWCEDPAHADYNRAITLPHPAGTDCMYRDDGLYDVVIVIGYNDAPVIAGKGSAIFIHHMRAEKTPTAGCIGLSPEDLLDILPRLTSDSTITILPPPAAAIL